MVSDRRWPNSRRSFLDSRARWGFRVFLLGAGVGAFVLFTMLLVLLLDLVRLGPSDALRVAAILTGGTLGLTLLIGGAVFVAVYAKLRRQDRGTTDLP